MIKMVSVVVAATVLALAMFVPVGAQNCASQYTVVAGDNLYRIGVRHNVPWPQIASANNLANPNLIFVGQVLCIPTPGTAGPTATGPTPTRTRTPAATTAATATRTATPAATAAGTAAPSATPGAVPTFAIPTFEIVGVQAGTSVTIRTANFPANQAFTALMGPIGSMGVNGTPAGTVNSGAGGVFTATIPIPASMATTPQIALRLQSPAGYYSFGWFYNSTIP
jgi:LysM repeat protein